MVDGKVKSLMDYAKEAEQIACSPLTLDDCIEAFNRIANRPAPSMDDIEMPSYPDYLFHNDPDEYHRIKEDIMKKSRFYTAPKKETVDNDDETCYDWFEGKPK